MERVQQELKLNEEQVAKVSELAESLRAEMREQFAALRDIEDREQRQAKMAELTSEQDRKARDLLRGVLDREQLTRLYQIRMQVRPAVNSLSSEFVANRLQLTPEQQAKLTQLNKETQAQQAELFSAMRDASDDQRSEVREKLRQARSEADEKALALLTDEQKAAFEKMKGEKIDLPRRGDGDR
jgi:hypothetical protein